MLPDYYEILRIPKNADLETIKKAYRARALECHPDRGGAHESILQVIEAFQILSNSTNRQHYDDLMRGKSGPNTQSVMQADISRARQKAEEYPREWSRFEAWMDTPTGQFFGPAISYVVLSLIGVAAVGVLGLSTQNFFGVGFGVVLLIGVIRWLTSGGSNTTPQPIQSVQESTQCSQCGQKLRVPHSTRPLKLRCPSCKFEFKVMP